MIDLTYDYTELLAKQGIIISALLCGLSTTVLATLILSKRDDVLLKSLIIVTALASFAFLISTFAMNNWLLISHPDYPLSKGIESIRKTRLIAGISFYLGVLFFCGILSLSGWLKSKKIGYITTIMGIITYFLLFTLT